MAIPQDYRELVQHTLNGGHRVHLSRKVSIFVLGAAFTSLAWAQKPLSGNLSAGDQKFIKEVAQGGMAEVALGQLAVQNAASDEVKKFGQRMVDDHSKANDQLKELAASKGVTLPQTPGLKEKAVKMRLSKLTGDQFDKAYMKDMLQDHKSDIAAFQKESNSGADSDVKGFATQTLPTLQDHLKEAETIAPKVLQARRAENTGSTSQQ